MSILEKCISDLIGAAAQMEFYLPVEDPNTQFNYDSKFGPQPNSDVINGMVITNPQVVPQASIKLYAALSGILYFTTTDILGKTIYGLRLTILPADTLALRATLPSASQPIAEILYTPVEKVKVSSAVKKILSNQGLSGAKLTSLLAQFMNDENEGILVKAGQIIGQSKGAEIKIIFLDTDYNVINPLYLTWHWWSLALKKSLKLEPKQHPIISKLKFNSLKLAVNESNMVVDSSLTGPSASQNDFGPYSFLL